MPVFCVTKACVLCHHVFSSALKRRTMSSKRTFSLLSIVVLLLAVATLWTTVGSAQGQRGAAMPPQAAAPPQRVSVVVTHVKPEMLGAYDDLIKNDLIPALKKAGVAWRWGLANAVAGPGYVRVSVTPVVNYAQYDQPGALARALGADGNAIYNAKLRTMVVSTETFIDTLQPNLSIQSNSGTPPVFLQVVAIQILSGKGAEFANLMATDYIANYKKLGVKDYWVYNRTFGGSQNLRILVWPLTKYAEIDQGPLLTQAVGADAAAPINARRAALISSQQIVYYRYVPALSFGMPAPRS